MSADSANIVLGVIAEKVITPVVNAIARQFGYLFCYNSNIKNLVKRIPHLEKARNDAERILEARERNNEERTETFTAWLNDVEDKTTTAKEVAESRDKMKGKCLNIKSRYSVSRKSRKLTEEIRKLQVQASKIIMTNPTPPAGMLPGSLSNDGSKGYESRIKAMDEIMAALEDDRVSIIGICGLGGVGKTTMVHELRERIRTQNLFQEFAMSSVSLDPNLIKIQADLGEMLDLKQLKDITNVIARADMLKKRLTNRNKILVILDDIWDEIKLKEIGIPVGSDCKGCKVVLTSRSEDACTRTGSQRNIKVKELSKEEAWDMFKEAAGECVESENLKGVSIEVVAECGGLPLALVTLAQALSNQRKEAWKDALKQLRESHVASISGMDEKVYKSIKLSYDFLARKKPQAKLLLLLCCQHPEDTRIEVEKLARYCFALELLEGVNKLSEARDRVYVLVEHLKSCFLLQELDVTDDQKEWGKDRKQVTVHDVVRDVCLSIVSEDTEEQEKVFTHVMPRKKDDGGNEHNTGAVNYPKLKILLGAPVDDTLSKNSLQQMEKLRVYEYAPLIRYEDKHQPPGALNVLKNLRLLSLEGAFIHEDAMSIIQELRELEILSFSGSKMFLFPCQIAQLSNLKLLDLRCRDGSGPIPSSILPQLNKLEELYTGHYYFSAAPKSSEEDIHGKNHGHVSELDSLSNLTSLHILVENPMELLDLQHVLFEKLERFHFRSTGCFRMYEAYINLRPSGVAKTFTLRGVEKKWVLAAKMELMVRSTVELYLEDMDWNDVVLLDKFVALERLDMRKWNNLKSIINDDDTEKFWGNTSCYNVFMNLEYLTICQIKNVRELCHYGILRPGSLGRLKRLIIWKLPKMRHLWVGHTDSLCLTNLQEVYIDDCESLKNIFPKSAAKCLVQLHRLEVSRCQKLEGIVCIDDTDVTLFPLLFPKLRNLVIYETSKFRGFCSFNDGRPQPLLSPLVILPSKEELDISFSALRQILWVGVLDVPKFDASEWLQNLKVIEVHDCDSLETVFDFEENAHAAFGKLQKIKLTSLPKLSHIFCCRMQDILIPQLHIIDVQGCDNLVNTIAPDFLKLLRNLKQVRLGACESVKAAFNFEGLVVAREDAGRSILGELEELRLWYLQNLEHVFKLFPGGTPGFQNLRLLDVRTCRGLSYLLSSSVAQMLVNLESLIVLDCDIMKEIIKMDEQFAGNKIMLLRSLRWVKLVRLENLLSFCSSDLLGFNLPSLEEVIIVECPVMKTFCGGPLMTEKLQQVMFAHSCFLNGELQGVKLAYPHFTFNDDVVYIVDEEPFWKSDLNETVQYYNPRVNQMHGDRDEISDRDEFVQSNNEGTLSESSKVSLSPRVSASSSSSSLVADDSKERFDPSSNAELRKDAAVPFVEPCHSKPDEGLLDSSSSPEKWKRSRSLIQGVYIEAKIEASFKEILEAKPDFLSGLRLKNAEVKTALVESAVRCLQILCHSTASTISLKQLAYIKDSLDDMESCGLDIAWLKRGYHRANFLTKEKRAVSASAELAKLERQHAEDEAAFNMARAKLEASAAQRDTLKAEYEGLMQELEDEKKLFFGDGFDNENKSGGRFT